MGIEERPGEVTPEWMNDQLSKWFEAFVRMAKIAQEEGLGGIDKESLRNWRSKVESRAAPN